MPRTLLALAALLTLLVGCSTPPPTSSFLHVSHRYDFALDVDELKDAGFYVSQNVLARNVSVEDNVPGKDRVVFVTGEDVGHVVDGGPDWLRVTFGGGAGIVFLTAGEAGDQAYYLATAVEGEPGFHFVKDLDEKYVLYEGQRFEITFGSHASLLIDSDDLRGLMNSRSVQTWTDRR